MPFVVMMLLLLLFPTAASANFETAERQKLREWKSVASTLSISEDAILQETETLYNQAASSIESQLLLLRQSSAQQHRVARQSIAKKFRKLLRRQIRQIQPPRTPKKITRVRKRVRSQKARALQGAVVTHQQRLLRINVLYEEAYRNIQELADEVYKSLGEDPLGKMFFSTMTITTIASSDVARMRAAGLQSYRVSWDWRAVQSGPGDPMNWNSFDYMIKTTAQGGLRLLPALHSTPAGWAGDWREMPVSSQAQRAGWRNFLQKAAERYGPGGAFWQEHPDVPRLPIRTWQIWNEANDHWFTNPRDPALYTSLLQISSEALRSVDPEAEIIATSLFPAKHDPPQSYSPEEFLRGMHQSGAKQYLDGIALHPYASSAERAFEIVRSFRQVATNTIDLPLWITEIGWQSDRATAFGVGGEAEQAAELRQAYQSLLDHRRRFRLRMISWFAWQDAPASLQTCLACYRSGLLREDSSAKPALLALEETLKAIP